MQKFGGSMAYVKVSGFELWELFEGWLDLLDNPENNCYSIKNTKYLKSKQKCLILTKNDQNIKKIKNQEIFVLGELGFIYDNNTNTKL